MSKPTVPGWWWIRFHQDEMDVKPPRTVGPVGPAGDIRECVYVFERKGVLTFKSRYRALGVCPVDEFGGEFLRGELPPD